MVHCLHLDMNDIIMTALKLMMKWSRQRKSSHKNLSKEVFTYSSFKYLYMKNESAVLCFQRD